MRTGLILLFLIFFQTLLIAQTNPYKDLLPTHQLPPVPSDEDAMRSLLQSCFSFTPNGSLPSGYARLGFDPASPQWVSRLETSTFRNTFIESCLISKANEFKTQAPSARNWTYCHISANCSEKFASEKYRSGNVRCSIEIALTSSKDSSPFTEQVEGHWKTEKENSNENYRNAAGVLYEILRLGK